MTYKAGQIIKVSSPYTRCIIDEVRPGSNEGVNLIVRRWVKSRETWTKAQTQFIDVVNQFEIETK